MTISRHYFALAALIASNRLAAQSVAPAGNAANGTPTTGPACTDPGYKQFDFWLGTWSVTGPQGKHAGDNVITKEMGGCVVHEHWVGGGNIIGESFNTYTPGRNKWHQTWVDNTGTLLLLDGEATADTMRLASETSDSTGVVTRHEIRYYPLDAWRDTVRQLWRVTTDGGVTWKTIFDGKYAKRP
jgi:hypothetical protein